MSERPPMTRDDGRAGLTPERRKILWDRHVHQSAGVSRDLCIALEMLDSADECLDHHNECIRGLVEERDGLAAEVARLKEEAATWKQLAESAQAALMGTTKAGFKLCDEHLEAGAELSRLRAENAELRAKLEGKNP